MNHTRYRYVSGAFATLNFMSFLHLAYLHWPSSSGWWCGVIFGLGATILFAVFAENK